MREKFSLSLLKNSYAICRLPAAAEAPRVPVASEFWSCTRTSNELSIVCETDQSPSDAVVDGDWRIVFIAAQMELDMVGVLASVLEPLRDAGISVFALSTFDTDYVLIREANVAKALSALRSVGYEIS